MQQIEEGEEELAAAGIALLTYANEDSSGS